MEDAMRRSCPNCKSLDVRLCLLPVQGEGPALAHFRSRFRCRECKETFWVINRRAYRLLGFFVRVNAAFVALIATLVFVYR